MADLEESLEVYLDKALKVVKSADKFINGAEKQLVLEIGSYTTKVIEYIVKDKEIEVLGGAILNTPANSIKNDRLVEYNALASIISKTLKEEKIKTKEFVISVASKDIIIREMNVPNMKEKELKGFVKINSNDIFPVNLSNYVLLYHIIEKGETNRIMIAAIPKDIIESYIRLADKLGLTLKGINYSGYELYNFLDFEIGTTYSSYLAFDVGAKNTNVLIISNGVLKFNKIISRGSEEISRFISEELNCPIAKAEQLKRQYNTIVESDESSQDSVQNAVIKYTTRCLDGVMQDIQRIIEFYNSNNPQNKIAKIYILGVIGKINGIENYVSQKLNVDTKSLKLLNKVSFRKKAMQLKVKSQNFMNCLGAHSLKNRVFYFIKDDLKIRNISFLLKSNFHKMVICAILIFVGIIIYERNSLEQINLERNKYEVYVNANKDLLTLRSELTSKIQQIESQKELINGVEIGVESYKSLLQEIENVVMPKINTQYNETGNIYIGIDLKEYVLKPDKISLKLSVALPEGWDQNPDDYLKYTTIPYDFQSIITETLKKESTIISNLPKAFSIEFTVEIDV